MCPDRTGTPVTIGAVASAESAWTPTAPADRRSRRGQPDPTSHPSAGTPRPDSPDVRLTIHRSPSRRSPIARPVARSGPARNWCANRPGGPATPARGQPASRRTPPSRRPRHTPTGRDYPPGRPRDGRGSSSATGRRRLAPPQVAAAAATAGGPHRRWPGIRRPASRPGSSRPIAPRQFTATPANRPASAVDKAPGRSV